MSTRLLPRHGEPLTRCEKVSQLVVRLLAWLPFYTAIIVTLTLLVLVLGLPFGWGQ